MEEGGGDVRIKVRVPAGASNAKDKRMGRRTRRRRRRAEASRWRPRGGRQPSEAPVPSVLELLLLPSSLTSQERACPSAPPVGIAVPLISWPPTRSPLRVVESACSPVDSPLPPSLPHFPSSALLAHGFGYLSGREESVCAWRSFRLVLKSHPSVPPSLPPSFSSQSPMALVTSPDGKKASVRGAHLGWSLNLYATESRRGANGNNVTVKKTILEGVTGSVRSGNIMALMGASGREGGWEGGMIKYVLLVLVSASLSFTIHLLTRSLPPSLP